MENKSKETVLYVCDPTKHIHCDKFSCQTMCKLTRYPEYAKTDKNGKPIKAKE